VKTEQEMFLASDRKSLRLRYEDLLVEFLVGSQKDSFDIHVKCCWAARAKSKHMKAHFTTGAKISS
jgi:hypothetical protein